MATALADTYSLASGTVYAGLTPGMSGAGLFTLSALTAAATAGTSRSAVASITFGNVTLAAASTSGAIPIAGGTVTQLGTTTLIQNMNQVYQNMGPITGETEAQARARIIGGQQQTQILDFCGAAVRGTTGRYYSLAINAGHSAIGDDGYYEYDLQTDAWVFPPRVFPSQYGATVGSTANIFGEYTSSPTGFGRPADQHTDDHVVAVGDDIVQAFGYSITVNGASGSRQAHRWRAATGAWSRYGASSGTFPVSSVAHCFYESGRGRIVRFPGDSGTGLIESISSSLADGDTTTAWTAHNITTSGGTFVRWPVGNLYKGIGYHPTLDCYVMIGPGQFTPRWRVYVLNAADLTTGWFLAAETTAPAAGDIMPISQWHHLEYVPPMNAFAIGEVTEPSKVYYLRPPASGVITDQWTWDSETFTGPAAAWFIGQASGVSSRLRWSALKNALVTVKNPNAVPEQFVPQEVVAYADWIARSTATGVVAAYDFSAPPANGGTYLWGSLSASPKVTVQAPDRAYDSTRIVDTTVYPPGSTASLRFDTLSGQGERGDQWRISIDNYADQFGENSEFWVQWRQRMNPTMATYQFKAGVDGNKTLWNGSYTQAKHCFFGWGMQFPYGVESAPATYYGYSPGASESNNVIATTRTDCDGEIVMKYDDTGTADGFTNAKYPAMYFSKAFHNLQDRGQDINYYTQRNGGWDFPTQLAYNGVRACQFFQSGGNHYTNRSSCYLYSADTWHTLMIRVKLGAWGTANDNFTGLTKTGYINSLIEYYGQETVGGPMVLLHRRAGLVLTGDFSGDVGAQGVGRYGMFGWTTFMTAKMFEAHPTASYWISQIIIKSGATAPAAPAF